MSTLENIIDEYIAEYGTPEEKTAHELYKGNYLTLFSGKGNNLEESMEVGGGEVFLFGALVFILETVGKSVIQDGYKFTKNAVLKYLKKDKEKLKEKTKKVEISEDTLLKLIHLLEMELSGKDGEEG
ncbi:MAG: hypothetical protein IPL49_10460 [Saprospirales bacterium]|nr:hypothetical protein [Saprospirales bacterium]MBK8491287.1 hypothetical protein [Saprospirales bacterium]